MRLRPLGKLLLFALVLGTLYAGYRLAPARYRSVDWRVGLPDLPKVTFRRPGAGISVQTPEPVAVSAPGVAVAGLPPPTLEQLSGSADGSVPVVSSGTSLAALDNVRTGRATAAVVDFPSVVYAAQSGKAPFRVVLLVGWRRGSDVVVSVRAGDWRAGDRIAFLKGTSGEYVVRRALDAPLPPALRKSLEDGLMPLTTLNHAAEVADALAGRRDQLPPAARTWNVRNAVSSDRLEDRIPDVLVVSETWAREKPEDVDALVRRWLDAQTRLQWGGATARRYYETYGRGAGMDELEVLEEMAPATVAEQVEFVGTGGQRGTWSKLAARQALLTERSKAEAAEVAPIVVDPRPLQHALTETKAAPAS
jgi:hypothetical protein